MKNVHDGFKGHGIGSFFSRRMGFLLVMKLTFCFISSSMVTQGYTLIGNGNFQRQQAKSRHCIVENG